MKYHTCEDRFGIQLNPLPTSIKVLFILLSVLRLPYLCVGQDFDRLYQPGAVYKEIELGDVRDWVRTDNGLFYIASRSHGLFRYNGRQKTKIELTSNTFDEELIIGVHLDTFRNLIWIASNKGIFTYDPVEEIVEEKLFDYRGHSWRISNPGQINESRSGELWFASVVGNIGFRYSREETAEMFILRDKGWEENFSSPKLIVGLYQSDVLDEVLFFIGENAIVKYNELNKESQFIWYKSDYDSTDYKVRDAVPIGADGFLLSTWSGELLRYNDSMCEIQLIDNLPPDLSNGGIVSLTPYDSNSILINGVQSIYSYDVENGDCFLIGSAQSEDEFFGIDEIVDGDILIDGHKGLKVSTSYNRQVDNFWIPDSIYSSEISSCSGLVKVNQSLWVSFYKGKGLYEFDLRSKVWKYYEAPDTLFLKQVNIPSMDLIMYDNETLMGVAHHAVYVFDLTSKNYSILYRSSDHFGENMVCLTKDNDGCVWVGTRGRGLFKFDVKTRRKSLFQSQLDVFNSKNYDGWFIDVRADEFGDVWVRNEDGFSVIQPATNVIDNYHFDQSCHEAMDHVSSFIEFENEMWLVGAGFVRVNKMDHSVIDCVYLRDLNLQVPFDHGLPVADYQVFFAHPGYGIYDVIRKRYNYIPYSLGLKEVPYVSVMLLQDSLIWMGHKNGLTMLDIDRIDVQPADQRPYISKVCINGKDCITPTVNGSNRYYDFGMDVQLLQFEFSAIDFESHEPLQFRLTLDGNEPITLDAENELSLTNLSFGRHILKVEVRSGMSSWSEDVYNFKFINKAHWHQRLEVRIAIGSFILFLPFLGFIKYYQFRNRRQKDENRILNLELDSLRAQMNPHFIFNCLNQVDSFILSNQSREASDLLSRFSTLIRQSLELTRMKMISIDQELEFIEKYLFVESKRFAGRFKYEIHINHEELASTCLVPPLLIQPYVENAIKHGVSKLKDGGMVAITDEGTERYYSIFIIDNGPGYNLSKSDSSHTSLATSILKDRMAKVNRIYGTNMDVLIISGDETSSVNENSVRNGTIVEVRIDL